MLLLALSGDAARPRLAAERRRGDDCYRRLLEASPDLSPARKACSTACAARWIGIGRPAPPDGGAHRPDALERYHKRVNPQLRQAVAACGAIREENFASMRRAGVRVRDVAGRATGPSSACRWRPSSWRRSSSWAARGVLRPVQAHTAAVGAIREGDFDVAYLLLPPRSWAD